MTITPTDMGPLFDGQTARDAQTQQRLRGQLPCVRHLLSDHQWWTLPQLVAALDQRHGITAKEQGVSARIRDLRKGKFGAHTIERRERAHEPGVWEYRMVEDQR